MAEGREDPAAWRRAAAELADELRAIAEALAVREVSCEALLRAGEQARRVRQALDGPPRPRWYEAGGDAMTITDASRRAYLDQSPIRGRLNPVAPPLEARVVERPDGKQAVEGRARLGMAYEGPPHGVHGGWVAALFDDLLGAAQGLSERRGVTASLTVRYRHVTPVEEDLHLAAWIDESRGRRMLGRATCHAGATLTAEAQALFVAVDFNEIRERMRGRRA